LVTGANPAWVSILFRRLKIWKKNKESRVIVIDPRKTDTAAADLHYNHTEPVFLLRFIKKIIEKVTAVTIYKKKIAQNYRHTKRSS
jgi:formylmethanofuran dehydrogenase subunit B